MQRTHTHTSTFPEVKIQEHIILFASHPLLILCTLKKERRRKKKEKTEEEKDDEEEN